MSIWPEYSEYDERIPSVTVYYFLEKRELILKKDWSELKSRYRGDKDVQNVATIAEYYYQGKFDHLIVGRMNQKMDRLQKYVRYVGLTILVGILFLDISLIIFAIGSY